MSRQALEVAFRSVLNPQPLLGKLGYVVNGVASVQTSDPALYNVRLDDGRFITAYHNNVVAPDFDRSVKLTTEVRDGKQVFVILGVAGGADGGNPGISAHSHSRASGMYFEVDTWLVSGFRVTPGEDPLTVQVGSGWYWYTGARHWFTGTILDISSEVPGTSNHHGWTALSFNPADETFTLTSGTSQSVALQLLEGNIPAAPTDTKDVAAFKLVNGMTELVDSDIVDTRFILWQQGTGTTTSGIVVYHADGSDPESFDPDSTGLAAASAAAATGDIVLLPPATITGNHTLSADVEYIGEGREATILTGQITLAAGSSLRNLSITRSASSSSALIGLLNASGTATAYDLTISVTNSGTGDAVGVKATGGTLTLHDSLVSGTAGTGHGYGTQPAGGELIMIGGVRAGSDAAGLSGSYDPMELASNGKDQAVFATIISPQAYYYNGRTYYTWCGASYSAYITYFDHATRTWATPVVIQTNPGSYDNHSTPAVIVADDGYIHVVNGGNSSASIPIYHLKSNAPEDISAWTLNTTIGTFTTYHELVKTADGTIYLFYRKQVSTTFYHCYRYTTDGTTWSSEAVAFNTYAAGDALYTSNAAYDETNGRIYMAWCYYAVSVAERRHIYIAYLKLSDGHFYAMDGTDLGTEVTALEASTSCVVYDSLTDEANQPNVKLESDGTVHVSFNRTVSTVWKHTYTYWTGSAWATLEDVATSGQQFACNDLWVNADGTVDLYGIVSTGGFGGDLKHWRRSVGGSWSLIRTIFDKTSYASGRNGVMNVQTVGNGAGDVIRAVFADDEYPSTANNLEIFAISSADTYVISSSGAQLYAVQTDAVAGDVALVGDRAVQDTVTYPDLHRVGGDTIHLPPPTAAGQMAISVSDGAGGYTWEVQTATAGTVTTVTASDPLSSTGGVSPNITHDTSGAAAGTYSNPTVTVDAYGHVTSISEDTGSGTEHLHGLARWVADGSTTTFDLPDIAEYLEMVFNGGSAVDQTTVTLSADGTQVTFTAAPTATNILQAQYVIARI